jgi:signal transduction histidine kinase
VQAVLRTGMPYVGDVRMGEVNQAPVVALAIPTRDAAGNVTGVLAGGFRLDQNRSGNDNLRFAGATAVEIVDRGGRIVVGTTTMDRLVSADPSFVAEDLGATEQGVVTDAVSPFGAPNRLIGWSTAVSADWLVLVDRPMSEAFGNVRSVLAVQLVIIGLAGSLAVGATLFALHRIGEAERRRAAAYAAEAAATDRLEVAVAQLREREQLRDAFVGVLSHELRTPVTSIYGAAKLLAKAPDRVDRESLVQDIEDESDRLYRMIEDLLVLSRAERGRLEVTTEPVLVQRLVPAVEGDLRRRFPSTRFVFTLPDSLPPVAAEPGPVRQVLNNLLTNAAKYGGGSAVRLTASVVEGAVRLVVEDSGPGFSAEEAEHLFELFYRAPGSAKMAAGTGIGLYVVRGLVEAMGGTVKASPGEGGGARFTVTLPVFGEDAP